MSSIKFKEVAHLYIGCRVNMDYHNSYGTRITGKKWLTISNFNKILQGKSKPILRPLSSMTEEEAIEIARLTECDGGFNDVKTEKTIYGDWIVTWQGNNESRERVNASGDVFYCSEQFIYLLKKGFDLFDLIYYGEALDTNE